MMIGKIGGSQEKIREFKEKEIVRLERKLKRLNEQFEAANGIKISIVNDIEDIKSRIAKLKAEVFNGQTKGFPTCVNGLLRDM